MTNRQDGAAAFEAAIGALEQEAVDLERQAAAARALVRQLRAHAQLRAGPGAGAAAAVAREKQRPATKSPDARALSQQAAPAAKPASVAPTSEAVAELEKLAAEVGRLDGLIKGEKDAAKLKDHVAAMLRAQRRGGELLISLAGKVKQLPVNKVQRKRWCRVAVLSPKHFSERVEQAAAAAIGKLSDGAGASAGTNDPLRPKRRQDFKPEPAQVKLTDWRQDETGVLARELIST